MSDRTQDERRMKIDRWTAIEHNRHMGCDMAIFGCGMDEFPMFGIKCDEVTDHENHMLNTWGSQSYWDNWMDGGSRWSTSRRPVNSFQEIVDRTVNSEFAATSDWHMPEPCPGDCAC